MTVVFDLDGTLCDVTHRLHHITGEKKDWDAFNAECVNDTLRQAEATLYKELEYSMKYIMVICTGRDERYREQTEQWLKDHDIFYDELHMRKAGDHRSDVVVKSEMISQDRHILFIVEDRRCVVDMWRERGFTCFQNAKGEF